MLFTRAGLTLFLFFFSASATLHRISCPSKDKKGVKKSLFGNKVFTFTGRGLLRCEYKGGAGKCEYSRKSPHHLMNGSDDCPMIKVDKHKGIVHKILHPKKKTSSSTTSCSTTSHATSTTKHRNNKHRKTSSASHTSTTSHATSTSKPNKKKFKTSRSSTSCSTTTTAQQAHTTYIKPTFHMDDKNGAIRVDGAVSTIYLNSPATKTSTSHSSSATPTPTGNAAIGNTQFSLSNNKTNITSNLAQKSAAPALVGQTALWALIPAMVFALMAL